MKHSELVLIAKRWLVKARKCSIVLTEKAVPNGEIPDAIGWRAGRSSILIECKTSRADFRRDKDKWFRQKDLGVGQQRFFMAPEGVIPVDELPDGWGLLEVTGTTVRTVVEHPLHFFNEQRAAAEVPLLVSCLRQAKVQLAMLKRKKRRYNRKRKPKKGKP